jgi:hypothetical protein
MALNPIITNEQFAELNEAIQSEYAVQEDGSYQLQVNTTEDGWELANTKNLLSAKRAEAQARKSYEKKYKPFDGLDPEEVAKALAFQADFDEKNINLEEKTNERIESIKKQLTKEYTDKEAGYQDRINRLISDMTEDKIDNKLRTALTPHVNDASDIDLLLPTLRKRMQLKEDENGRMMAIVLDEYGDELVTSSTEKDAALKVLIKEMKGKHARWFKSEAPAGSGAGDVKSGGSTPSNVTEIKKSDFDKMSESDRMELMVDIKTGQPRKVKVIDG